MADVIAAVFVIRGLINLLLPFDEYYDFLGDTFPWLLNVLTVVVGIGIYKRTAWGYLAGLVICIITFVAEADRNALERWGSWIMSIILFMGLRKTEGFFTKAKNPDWWIALGVGVLLVGTGVYAAVQPSDYEVFEQRVNIALETMDISICNNMDNIRHKGQCILRLNFKLKDPSLCEIIDDEGSRNSCYAYIAMELSNVSYCEKITEEWIKNGCLEQGGVAVKW